MRDLDEEPALLARSTRFCGRWTGSLPTTARLRPAAARDALRAGAPALARSRVPPRPAAAARRLGAAAAGLRLGTVEQHALGFARERDLPARSSHPCIRVPAPQGTGELPRSSSTTVTTSSLLRRSPAGWPMPSAGRLDPISKPRSWPGSEALGVGGRRSRRGVLPDGARRRTPEPRAGTRARALAWREKRRSRWDASRVLWRRPRAGRASSTRCRGEEMAKIHEHRLRDLPPRMPS